MKKKIFCLFFLALMLFVAVSLTACIDDGKESETNPSVTGGSHTEDETFTVKDSVFTSFVAQDFDGNIIDETVFAGYKVTMINVWGTYCAPCKAEMPELAELDSEYKSRGFQIIGIPIDGEKQRQKAIALISETHADYRHLRVSNSIKDFLADIKSVPYTIFLNEKGEQIGEAYIGARSKEDWKKLIDRNLDFVSN